MASERKREGKREKQKRGRESERDVNLSNTSTIKKEVNWKWKHSVQNGNIIVTDARWCGGILLQNYRITGDILSLNGYSCPATFLSLSLFHTHTHSHTHVHVQTHTHMYMSIHPPTHTRQCPSTPPHTHTSTPFARLLSMGCVGAWSLILFCAVTVWRQSPSHGCGCLELIASLHVTALDWGPAAAAVSASAMLS